eukprot:CAMPEP_0119365516 /NCGR_PEP_ID=MMETSP1334-20130426/12459_1 /TAXON_ID=127549 /ORGANISM="Calcidiscus leptoporus, Strain RCC1130" /LENGTH=74 /DNA_ID=CAMNT_0007381517 /DNA_START=462 /DNA_END=686 /DNA_ORIENTATION=+
MAPSAFSFAGGHMQRPSTRNRTCAHAHVILHVSGSLVLREAAADSRHTITPNTLRSFSYVYGDLGFKCIWRSRI